MTETYSGLHVGQRFSTLEEFKTLIRSISVRQHWELRVIRSNKKSVVIGCRSAATCFFRVVCRSNKNATYITSLQDSHGCQRSTESSSRTPSRSEASHVRFLLGEIPKLFDTSAKIKGQDVVDAVKRYHGYDISMRQAQRALIKLQSHDDDTQGDQAVSLDLAGDQHSPAHSQPESQGEGPAYRDASESRWITDPLGSSLIDEETVDLNEAPSGHAAVAPAPPTAQPARPPPILQPSPIGPPDQAPLGNDMRQMTVPQPGVGYPTTETLPVAGPGLPKPPYYAPRVDSHGNGIPQMVLTNFKIEFTCTACGSLNQSFFPNQGNVTGAGYMDHHSVPSQTNVPRNADPAAPDEQDNGGDIAGHGSYAVNALNARVMQNAWATGGLGVPIGPTNT